MGESYDGNRRDSFLRVRRVWASCAAARRRSWAVQGVRRKGGVEKSSRCSFAVRGLFMPQVRMVKI